MRGGIHKKRTMHNAQNAECTMHNAQCTMHNANSICLCAYPNNAFTFAFWYLLWFGWAMFGVGRPYVWNGGLENWEAKW